MEEKEQYVLTVVEFDEKPLIEFLKSGGFPPELIVRSLNVCLADYLHGIIDSGIDCANDEYINVLCVFQRVMNDCITSK